MAAEQDHEGKSPGSDFLPIFRTSPYTELIGPLLYKGRGLTLQIGLMPEMKHCNARGLVHGGVLSALVDITMGYGAAFSNDPPLQALTTCLSIDFMGSARAGEWIHTSVEGLQVGKRLIFTSCFVHARGLRIARASGVFSNMS